MLKTVKESFLVTMLIFKCSLNLSLFLSEYFLFRKYKKNFDIPKQCCIIKGVMPPKDVHRKANNAGLNQMT